MEIWKDVAGYEGLYQVSNMGRVMRVAGGGHGTWHGRILKLWLASNGYLRVTLWRDGRRKTVMVHRLVAEKFLGPVPSPKHEINHRNGIKTDNRVENLEWVTSSENHQHAITDLGKTRSGEANGHSKLTRRQVRQIRKLYATGKHSQRKLAKKFGVDQTNIGYIVRRETWAHVA